MREQLKWAPQFVQDWIKSSEALTAASSHPIAAILLVEAIPAVIFAVFSYLNIYLLQWVAVRAIQTCASVLSLICCLSASFFSQASIGELISRCERHRRAPRHHQQRHGRDGEGSRHDRCPARQPEVATARLTLISMVVLPLCVVPIVIYGRKAPFQQRVADAWRKADGSDG
jgi:hypothetical protein